jgi:hypothetical protein
MNFKALLAMAGRARAFARRTKMGGEDGPDMPPELFLTDLP